jgi:hypothetical protein
MDQRETGLNRLRGMVCLNRKAPHYGWDIVIACNFVGLMTWGIDIFKQGVFLGFFEREDGCRARCCRSVQCYSTSEGDEVRIALAGLSAL